MKLQQLRYAVEVYRRNLNVSDAAEALYTSQPGVSKQIRLLEEELGTQIFIRSGKRIVSLTQPGQIILDTAEQILRDVQKIKNISGEFTATNSGSLTIAATHTQARYCLPDTVRHFIDSYPEVHLTIRQGTPQEIAEMVQKGEADFAVGTELPDDMSELKKLPCDLWKQALLVPKEHALAKLAQINLYDLAAYPLISYDFTFHAGTSVSRAFNRARISNYRVAFASSDNDVLKTYVRLGLGIGLMDAAAYDAERDSDLTAIDINHLFEPVFTQIAVRGDTLLRSYTYDFIQWFYPPFTRSKLDQLLYAPPMEDFSI